MYVSLFNYVWILESPSPWDGAAVSVHICLIRLLMSLHVLTSFPCSIVGEIRDLIVSVPDRCPLQLSSPKYLK